MSRINHVFVDGVRVFPVSLGNRESRLTAVRKRINHLTQRINSSPKDLSYDKQEREALIWMLWELTAE